MLEILFGALAEAVLSRVVEDFSNRPKIMQFRKLIIGKDSPENIVLTESMISAYEEFKIEHPDLANSFFDSSFLLKENVVQEIAKLLHPTNNPDIQFINQEWKHQFGSIFDIDISPQINQYIELLDVEIKSKKELLPLLDSKSLQELYKISGISDDQLSVLEEIRDNISNIVSNFNAKHDEVEKAHNFYEHINLPANYIERKHLLTSITNVVLKENPSVTIENKNPVTVLHGMGGVGKSVVARAICNQLDIQNYFEDGIIWVSLGQDPNIQEKVVECLNLFEIDSDNIDTILTLQINQLAKIIREKKCLFILDDVWDFDQVNPFFVSAGNSKYIITSRNAEIAIDLSASVISIPIMDTQEAFNLLKKWCENPIFDHETRLGEDIVKKLGYLPLAIKLAGAQMRTIHPQKWLNHFDLARLSSTNIVDAHGSFVKTIELSVNLLSTEEKEAFYSLGIFKEEEPIREYIIKRLWKEAYSVEDLESEILLAKLSSLALFEINQDTGGNKKVKLHDLIREFVSKKISNIEVLHNSLLRTYKSESKEWRWSEVEDDGYIHNHLVFHLVRSNNTTEARKLFNDDTWLRNRFRSSLYRFSEYSSDISELLELNNEIQNIHKESFSKNSEVFLDNIKLALIKARINTLNKNVGKEFLLRALEIGVWNLDQVLSIIENTPEASERVKLLLALLTENSVDAVEKYLIIRKALSLLSQLRPAAAQIDLIVEVYEYLDSQLQKEMSNQCLSLLASLKNIHQVSPYQISGKSGFSLVIKANSEFANIMLFSSWKANLIKKATPCLGKEHFDQLLNIIDSLPHAVHQISPLIAASNHYLDNKDELINLSIERILSLPVERVFEGDVITENVITLLEKIKNAPNVVSKLLDFSSQNLNLENQAKVLIAFSAVFNLSQDALIKKLMKTRENIEEFLVIGITAEYCKATDRELWNELLESTISEIVNSGFDTLYLMYDFNSIYKCLPNEKKNDFFNLIMDLNDENKKAGYLGAIIEFLSETKLNQVIEFAFEIQSEEEKAGLFLDLAHRIPHKNIFRICEDASQMESSEEKNRVLSKYAKYMDKFLLLSVLEKAGYIDFDQNKFWGYMLSILKHLPDPYRKNHLQKLIDENFYHDDLIVNRKKLIDSLEPILSQDMVDDLSTHLFLTNNQEINCYVFPKVIHKMSAQNINELIEYTLSLDTSNKNNISAQIDLLEAISPFVKGENKNLYEQKVENIFRFLSSIEDTKDKIKLLSDFTTIARDEDVEKILNYAIETDNSFNLISAYVGHIESSQIEEIIDYIKNNSQSNLDKAGGVLMEIVDEDKVDQISKQNAARTALDYYNIDFANSTFGWKYSNYIRNLLKVIPYLPMQDYYKILEVISDFDISAKAEIYAAFVQYADNKAAFIDLALEMFLAFISPEEEMMTALAIQKFVSLVPDELFNDELKIATKLTQFLLPELRHPFTFAKAIGSISPKFTEHTEYLDITLHYAEHLAGSMLSNVLLDVIQYLNSQQLAKAIRLSTNIFEIEGMVKVISAYLKRFSDDGAILDDFWPLWNAFIQIAGNLKINDFYKLIEEDELFRAPVFYDDELNNIYRFSYELAYSWNWPGHDKARVN